MLIISGYSININIFLLGEVGYHSKLLFYWRNTGNTWGFFNDLKFIIIEKIRLLAVYNYKIGSLGIDLVRKINIKTFSKGDICHYCSNPYYDAQNSQA